MLYTGAVKGFGEYILEQSVSVRAISEFIKQSFVPVLNASGQIMLKCISKHDLIKIYHVV